jgi:tight adherence protein B
VVDYFLLTATPVLAGSGLYLLQPSGGRHGPRDVETRLRSKPSKRRAGLAKRWLIRAGVAVRGPGTWLAHLAKAAVGGAVSTLLSALIFGQLAMALAVGMLGAAVTYLESASAQRHEIAQARGQWPAIVDAIRIAAVELGQSLPNATWQSARMAPPAVRRALTQAQNRYRLGEPFAAALEELGQVLPDGATAHVVATLSLCDQASWNITDSLLSDLVDDLRLEEAARQDALAHQAGARFARGFVLIVPAGMALAGMSIGGGRQAFATPLGLLAGLFSLSVIYACWQWANHLLRLPDRTG